MHIHSLFILRESGICLYSKHITEQFKDIQVDLITPFFSAILSFSNKVLSKHLEVLEMSDLRFVFKKVRGILFVILSDSHTNLLFIKSRLDIISNSFFKFFEDRSGDIATLENEKYDEIVDTLILGTEEIQPVKESGLYQNVIEYFKELVSQKEIVGAALLTTKGTIIYSSLTEDLLLRVMKELEIRYTTGTFDVPELFYTLGNDKKVCERIISYKNFINLLLIVQYPANTQLGMVDYETETIANKLQSFLKSVF